MRTAKNIQGSSAFWGAQRHGSERTASLEAPRVSSGSAWIMAPSCATTGRRYLTIKNNAEKRLYPPNLLEPLWGLENRPGRLPCLGHNLEERPLPCVLPERMLRLGVTRLLGRLVFYYRREEVMTGFLIVWGSEAGSKGRVGCGSAAV